MLKPTSLLSVKTILRLNRPKADVLCGINELEQGYLNIHVYIQQLHKYHKSQFLLKTSAAVDTDVRCCMRWV